MRRQLRQGDIMLTSIPNKPDGLKPTKPVLALGESTGHRHEIIDGEVFVGPDGRRFVEAREGTEIQHLTSAGAVADHAPLTIEPGWYEVGIERELDPFTDREAGFAVD